MGKKLMLSVFGVFGCLFSGCAVNPITGEEELMFYPEQQDVAVGRKYAPEVEKHMGGKIADENLQNYIDSIGQKIARVSHRPDLEYHFVALKHESLNALALPGGYIFITKGMLEKLTSEAQLAGILAHETTHVVARDTSAALSRMHVMDLFVAAIAISGATPEGAGRMAQLTALFLSLRYSRQDEQEADLGGLDYMVRAGYDPRGMVETMQTLQKEDTVRPIEFFSTHPSPENRIAYLTETIQTKYSGVAQLKVGEEDYRSAVLQHLTKNKKPTAAPVAP
jgi:predicted Zn-dependent protease